MSNESSVLEFIRPETRAIPPVGEYDMSGFQHQMQWNENPFDLPAELKAAVLQHLAERPWSRYSGFRPYELIRRTAQFHGVDPAQVVVGNGSSDVLRVALSAILGPGDAMVVPSPTFMVYHRYCRFQGAEVLAVPLSMEEGFALPTDDIILKARTNQAKLVVICAPNNPTGTVYAADELRRVVEECGCLVLIDEAYAQFCNQDLTSLLDDFENLILVRTFSKAFAMAGVRLGYALTSAPLATQFQKLFNSFTLSVFSEATALAVLEHPAYVETFTQQLVAERERMAEALDELPGAHVYPSGTNFLLVKLDRSPEALLDYLKSEHSMLISDMSSYPQLSNHVRISIGAPEQNELLVQAFQHHLGGERPTA